MIDVKSDSRRLEVTLDGPGAESGRLRLDALVELGVGLQTALHRIALGLGGKATKRPGRRPQDVADLTRLALVGYREGSTVLELELAERSRPFAELDVGERALGDLVHGLRGLTSGSQLPTSWDDGVLEAVEQVTRMLDRGVDSISIADSADPLPSRVTLDRQVRGRIASLRTTETSRREVEVEGRLLMADFAATKDQARIHPPLGAPVRVTFTSELESAVADLLRRYVRARGEAEVDETGRVSVVHLQAIEEAGLGSTSRSFWDQPTLDELSTEQGVEPLVRLEEAADSTWPEGESVDDFLAAIEYHG